MTVLAILRQCKGGIRFGVPLSLEQSHHVCIRFDREVILISEAFVATRIHTADFFDFLFEEAFFFLFLSFSLFFVDSTSAIVSFFATFFLFVFFFFGGVASTSESELEEEEESDTSAARFLEGS